MMDLHAFPIPTIKANEKFEMNKLHEVERIGDITVSLRAIEEHLSLESCFSECCTSSQLRGMQTRIDNGNAVFATIEIVLSSDVNVHGQPHVVHLDEEAAIGGCYETSIKGFLENGYYPQLREEAFELNAICSHNLVS